MGLRVALLVACVLVGCGGEERTDAAVTEAPSSVVPLPVDTTVVIPETVRQAGVRAAADDAFEGVYGGTDGGDRLVVVREGRVAVLQREDQGPVTEETAFVADTTYRYRVEAGSLAVAGGKPLRFQVEGGDAVAVTDGEGRVVRARTVRQLGEALGWDDSTMTAVLNREGAALDDSLDGLDLTPERISVKSLKDQ